MCRKAFLLGFFETVRAVTTTALAAITALEQESFGENHEAVFVIKMNAFLKFGAVGFRWVHGQQLQFSLPVCCFDERIIPAGLPDGNSAL